MKVRLLTEGAIKVIDLNVERSAFKKKYKLDN
jgi:hypothetical protein